MLEISQGRMADCRDGDRISTLQGWSESDLGLDAEATHFGFIFEGTGRLQRNRHSYPLDSGMYFSLPGRGWLSGQGSGIVISLWGYRGWFLLGGPVESSGRLRYIDGCSDSLLIPPIVKGDPCLNLLWLPPATQQTSHTHPSHRIGVIVTGRGVCRTPEQDDSILEPGSAWVIAAGAEHSFHTGDQGMATIAYHPDSDFGPSHDDHPMLNRTFIQGVSARRLRPGN